MQPTLPDTDVNGRIEQSLIGIYSVLLHVEITAFHPLHKQRLVSVALVLTLRWTAVSRYVALGARTFLPMPKGRKAVTQSTLQTYKRAPRFIALFTNLSASLFFSLGIFFISTFLNPDIK